MLDLLEAGLFFFGGVVGGLLYLGGLAAWERLKPDPPADYTLTLSDPDGIPVRQHKMTAKGRAGSSPT